MSELSQYVSWGDQPPLQRLSRSRLQRFLADKNIPHSQDATKDALIKIIEGNELDVTAPDSGIQWQAVRGKDEHGRDHTELFPVRPGGHASKHGVDVDAVIQKKLQDSRDQAAQSAKKDGKIERLEAENQLLYGKVDDLTDKLNQVLERLGAPKEVLSYSAPAEISYKEVKDKAKSLGINCFHKSKEALLGEIEKLETT